jgi:hypothetical protein
MTVTTNSHYFTNAINGDAVSVLWGTTEFFKYYLANFLPAKLNIICVEYYPGQKLLTCYFYLVVTDKMYVLRHAWSFTVLRATLRSTKLINFTSIKVLKHTSYFGQHGHHQVLKICLLEKWLLVSTSESSNFLITHIFNTWWWPCWPKHVVYLKLKKLLNL